tara:strand:- start:2830 stop:3618 length:789 start_codon:yes stop_codon:yes gene_type:complete
MPDIMHTKTQMKQGFSLVELSIVLVILGLLTGGILTGQSLIRAAELRSVVTEMKLYQTAAHSFRDKYFAIPGDMRNATQFWGDNATACADAAVVNGSPGTCNGDGDGSVSSGVSAPNVTAEEYQFWHQLALAGLIEGSFTGLMDSAGELTAGQNVPFSKLSNMYWRARNFNPGGSGSTASAYAIDLGNSLATGTVGTGRTLTPEETWNIDTKMDDGLPAQGKVIARPWTSECTTSTSRTDFSGKYQLSATSKGCEVYYRQPY